VATNSNLGTAISLTANTDDDDDADGAVEGYGATSASGAKEKSAGAAEKAPPAAKAGFAFGEGTVKAAKILFPT
jgi:hypothetical protein